MPSVLSLTDFDLSLPAIIDFFTIFFARRCKRDIEDNDVRRLSNRR